MNTDLERIWFQKYVTLQLAIDLFTGRMDLLKWPCNFTAFDYFSSTHLFWVDDQHLDM